jgi:hypothetical protein
MATNASTKFNPTKITRIQTAIDNRLTLRVRRSMGETSVMVCQEKRAQALGKGISYILALKKRFWRSHLFLLVFSATCFAEPVEELGTMVFFVPQTQASASASDEYGLVATVLQRTDADNIKTTFVAHSAREFVRRFRKLPEEQQERGIWVYLEENDPYSAQEKTVLEELKALCKKHHLWLFVRVGFSGAGWEKISGVSPKILPCPEDHQKLEGKAFERLSALEKQLIGTWVSPSVTMVEEDGTVKNSDDFMRITLTPDHWQLWCSEHDGSRFRAKWRLEGNVFVITYPMKPKGSELPNERRETIFSVNDTVLVFTDGTVEGHWTRMR